MSDQNNEKMPLLVTRGIIVFPDCSEQLDVGRVFSLNAVTRSLSDFDGKIVICSQIDPDSEEIKEETIYGFGTLCNISTVREQKGFYKIRVTGIARVRLKDADLSLTGADDYLKTDFDVIESIDGSDEKTNRP